MLPTDYIYVMKMIMINVDSNLILKAKLMSLIGFVALWGLLLIGFVAL